MGCARDEIRALMRLCVGPILARNFVLTFRKSWDIIIQMDSSTIMRGSEVRRWRTRQARQTLWSVKNRISKEKQWLVRALRTNLSSFGGGELVSLLSQKKVQSFYEGYIKRSVESKWKQD